MLPEPNWNKFIKRYNNYDKSNINTVDDILKKIIKPCINPTKIILNKHFKWRNENEFRLLSSKPNNSQFINSAINSVTFGLEADDNSKRYICSIISRFYGTVPVKLYKMVIKDRLLKRIPFDLNDASPHRNMSVVTPRNKN